MIIVVQNGWHSFAVDGTNLNIISAVSNIGQRYAFLYSIRSSDNDYVYCLEIYKYGFSQQETKDTECTVYYLA